MRISHLELSWFRGAGERALFETGGKSVVVYGANGAGKSSYVDAIEFAINGKLSHLTHEYSGRKQERGILNTHRPKGTNGWVEVGLAEDAKREISIADDGSVVSRGTEKPSIEKWEYRRTVLRQDEVASFVVDTKGNKYAALLPLLGLDELEMAAGNLRSLKKAFEEVGRVKELSSKLAHVRELRQKIFGTKPDAEIQLVVRSVAMTVGVDDSEAAAIGEVIAAATQAFAERLATLDASTRTHVVLAQIAASSLVDDIALVRKRIEEFVRRAEPLLDERLEILDASSRLAGGLGSTESLQCPSCGQSVRAADFIAHAESETRRLSEIAELRTDRDDAVGQLCDGLQELRAACLKDEVSDWANADSTRLEAIRGLRAHDVRRLRTACRLEEVASIEHEALPLIDAAHEASKTAPAAATALAESKELLTAAALALSSAEDERCLADARALMAYAAELEAQVRSQITTKATAAVKDISESVRQMWEILHPTRPIREVEVYLPEDSDKAIDIRLRFHGVVQDSPRLTLSEGYRNSLGLCLFLAMAESDSAAGRPLVLDDVIVSLDREHRGMLVEILRTRFANRQVLLFTHDRDWYVELRHLLPEAEWSFRMLMPFSEPEEGIRWAESGGSFAEAASMLATRPDAAGNDARKVMDIELALAASRLKLRLPYLRGEKNDMRMAAELLDALRSAGKRAYQVQDGEEYVVASPQLDLLDDARRHLIAWGNRASHSFDLVRAEAEKLIGVCQAAREAFKCKACEKWVWYSDAGTVEHVQCACGGIRWRYGRD